MKGGCSGMANLRRLALLYGGNDTTRIFGDGVISRYLARAGLARRMDIGVAGDDEPDFPLGQPAV